AFLSRYDDLTGQFNRARFVEILNETMENAKRFNTSSGLLIAAIDNLSVINDCYGYEIADEVIAVSARRIKSRLRGGDALGRYSGNKFGILLYDCSESEISVAAKRLIEAMCSEVVSTAAGPVAASVTIGGVIIPRYAQSSAEAAAYALDALDQAKRLRRGSFVVFRPSKAREDERQRNIEVSREVVAGLKKQLFRFAYQPIVDADSGKVKYHECLLRLDRGDGTTAPAETFIPLIEKLGLNRMIDQRAMELALADLAEFADARLSFNLTGATASNPDWLSYLAAHLRPHAEVAERLTVEITETMALHDIDAARHFIETLKDLGCRVAIDDFGAGYTSFRNLKLFDIDMVKIDGSFIKRLHESPEDQVFVRTLIELAKTFDIETAAEWVGDERTVDILRGWGIDLLQGHYCGAAQLEKPWQA
ncbi:MAG: bifunctional diguanylate cyclase/phosphodiesterase, partial [Hyphomicrobiales bacterium]|nr:bifunctional diguanylate cyclase/phosphodiesterase [Hyphomicrobiales bacterium]